ncbi:VOC family protein [Kribbella sp. NBC_01245]|uniref:VOC family protein n=1 Tax=Kribbella sp. NBC_01245 TaxID=2903578 RepID=UPI002E27FC4D|nr:VOC family protein [Kribbella sp. NBC_01245]
MINRTMGSASVVPELVYDDVGAAVDWLCDAFGFTEMWRVGNHRARIRLGNGIVVIADADPSNGRTTPTPGDPYAQSTMVQVDDVNAHYEHARSRDALVLTTPTDYAFGERMYSAQDPAGHHWTFSQSIADLPPEAWGGTTKSP